MQAHGILGWALSAVVASACSTYPNVPAGEVTAGQVGEAGRWSAAISPPPAAGALPINGWAAMVPDSSGHGTLVRISLADVPAGSVPRWSVHAGKCEADEGVFGSAAAYEPIKTDQFGRGTASARIPLPTPAAGNYFVSVQAPSTGGEVTIACGRFIPPGK